MGGGIQEVPKYWTPIDLYDSEDDDTRFYMLNHEWSKVVVGLGDAVVKNLLDDLESLAIPETS